MANKLVTEKRRKGQNVVPVKDEDIQNIFSYLEEKQNIVILAVIKFALNTGLRISDVLKLKFEDLKFNSIIEKKTRKRKRILFNEDCLIIVEVLSEFYKEKGIKNYNTGFLFKSMVNRNMNKEIPLSYQGINFHIKKIRDDLGITYAFNTHSFRKAWARRAYFESEKNIALIMKVLNHSSPDITLRYIGIEDEDIDELFLKIKF